jgi:geranyl-CoA carboxylase alpha subunit
MTSLTPFNKVLVANRGEIALRVIRTARLMGYGTVAVYSTADADSLHVQAADEAVCIGEALPAESYLRIDHIIEAAKLTGADAIHPGYGFLAENEAFAQACSDAGIRFIGPSAEAIVSMGNKAGAKAIMSAAGVPCIAGYQGEDQSASRLIQEAQRIGFPVMIKATAGGGGRGMRLVHSADDFPSALNSAKSEALSAFGDDEVILERAIIEPRHIEIQIMADRHGHAVALGERDCSIQRRHQKIIEEAPSPAVSPALRAEMGATAVKAVKAIGYEGAGTLEFLLDQAGHFYFMEMNTRLQVEHPVTELVTGLDLVELQFRVAAGEVLPITQDDVQIKGHAIEVRLCAEDPVAQFMPQSGRMDLWRPYEGLRVEHALRDGSEIPPFYDSMVAKFIAYGADREEARRRLIDGLTRSTALGVKTNLSFLTHCLRHPNFIEGAATTAFIAHHGSDVFAQQARVLDAQADKALALAAWLFELNIGGPTDAHPKRTLTNRLPVPRVLIQGDERMAVTVSRTLDKAHQCHFKRGEISHTLTLQLLAQNGNRLTYQCKQQRESITYHRDGARLALSLGGHVHVFEDRTLAQVSTGDALGGDGKLRASMTGRVVALHAQIGQTVAAGQPILTLEAMKMEHVHLAPVSGTLKDLHAAVGEQLASGRVIAEIDAPQAIKQAA